MRFDPWKLLKNPALDLAVTLAVVIAATAYLIHAGPTELPGVPVFARR